MSNDDIILAGANDNLVDNMILPFQLEASNLRGRIIRMGSVLQDILAPHAYPDPVAQLVGEAAGLSLLLGGMLKYDGVFTLQAQGNGPVRMVVADLTNAGDVRGMAHYDPDIFKEVIAHETVAPLKGTQKIWDLETLMGTGYLAFTVDQGEHTERYQGIVAFQGDDLTSSVSHYFSQSEQIGTAIQLACARVGDEWRVGGIMIQRLPPVDQNQSDDMREKHQDDWDRARALLETCKPEELLRPTLLPGELLFRLFHEEGVRVFNPLELRKGCRCNMEKLGTILKTMSPDDLDHMSVNGKITMTCEFCNRNFDFEPDAFIQQKE